MDKNNPIFIASMAFFAFFIVFIVLKYLLNNQVDIQNAITGAIFFWVVVFVVHQLMNKKFAQ